MTRKISEALGPEHDPFHEIKLERELKIAVDVLRQEDAPSRMLKLARELDAAIAMLTDKRRAN